MFNMTWIFGCVSVNMTKPMRSYPLLRFFLRNKSSKLKNSFRLASHHHIKPALREDQIQVINEFYILLLFLVEPMVTFAHVPSFGNLCGLSSEFGSFDTRQGLVIGVASESSD
uniref:Uncharacterized protein n=1 Tax=Medicago truncatula TaxID=3880 RepID=A2Q255_MEDTR|nr:hypothetical protein MtrDRAFT_AC149208g34v2 [Medicago truncatula]